MVTITLNTDGFILYLIIVLIITYILSALNNIIYSGQPKGYHWLDGIISIILLIIMLIVIL